MSSTAKPPKKATQKKPSKKKGKDEDGPERAFYTPMQREFLVEAVRKRQHILECKKTDAVLWHEKRKAWEDLAKDFNAQVSEVERTADQLRNKWKLMKKDAGKLIRKANAEKQGTGGGPSTLNLPPLIEKIYAINPKSFIGSSNPYDSDGANYARYSTEVSIGGETDADFEMIENNGSDDENDPNIPNGCSYGEFKAILASTIPDDSIESDYEATHFLSNNEPLVEVATQEDGIFTQPQGDSSQDSGEKVPQTEQGNSQATKESSPRSGGSTEEKEKADWSKYNIPALRSQKSDALTTSLVTKYSGKKRRLRGKTVQDRFDEERAILIATQKEYYSNMISQNQEKHTKEMELLDERKELEKSYWESKKASEVEYWLNRDRREEEEAKIRRKVAEAELKALLQSTSSCDV